MGWGTGLGLLIWAKSTVEAYQMRGLVKDITDAVCRNFKVPPEAVSIMIQEGKKENRARAGKLAIDS